MSISLKLIHVLCLGNPDLFSYAQNSVFVVKCLGHLRDVSQDSTQENQINTLITIDTAQVSESDKE